MRVLNIMNEAGQRGENRAVGRGIRKRPHPAFPASRAGLLLKRWADVLLALGMSHTPSFASSTAASLTLSFSGATVVRRKQR